MNYISERKEKMKATVKIAAVVLASCLLFSSCSKQPTEAAAGYAIAGNDYVDYTFEYPEKWVIDRNDGMIAVKPENESISISCTSFVPDDPTVLAQEYWDSYFTSFKETFGEKVEILKEEETKLGGAAAKYVTYTAEIVGETYQFTQVCAMMNGTAYTLTYTATPETHDANLGALTHAVTSFKLCD